MRPQPITGIGRIGLRVFYAICAGLFLADFIYHRHAVHPLEGWWGFYAFYGFIACVLLVLVAKEMRKVLMRSESYYEEDSHEQDRDAPPSAHPGTDEKYR